MRLGPFIENWFDGTDAANQGGVTRRRRDLVETNSSCWISENGSAYVTAEGLEAVVKAARARNWHVIETGNQVVVFHHDGQVHIHC